MGGSPSKKIAIEPQEYVVTLLSPNGSENNITLLPHQHLSNAREEINKDDGIPIPEQFHFIPSNNIPVAPRKEAPRTVVDSLNRLLLRPISKPTAAATTKDDETRHPKSTKVTPTIPNKDSNQKPTEEEKEPALTTKEKINNAAATTGAALSTVNDTLDTIGAAQEAYEENKDDTNALAQATGAATLAVDILSNVFDSAEDVSSMVPGAKAVLGLCRKRAKTFRA